MPHSRKVRFAIDSPRRRTFGRSWSAQKQPAETCPVFPKRLQGNEIADRNIHTLSLTALHHHDIFVHISFEPKGSGGQFVFPRRQLRKRVTSRQNAAGFVNSARVHILHLYRRTGYGCASRIRNRTRNGAEVTLSRCYGHKKK